jgi:hypothetical protein
MNSILDFFLLLPDIYSLEKSLPYTIRNEPIVKITYATYPVKLVRILNSISDGRLEESIRYCGYEQSNFHIIIIINDTYALKKGFRPMIQHLRKPPVGNTTDIDLPEHFMGTTINDFVRNTKEYMGDEMFLNYSLTMNNCHDFIWACLVANHLTDNIPKLHIEKIVQVWLEKWLSDIIIGFLDN